ncbi:glycosyltransferase family 4 protein [Thiocapsa rosea]|uniref:Glycosyltransferase involved in cell wall biosynthesis n=1 Tax=Thiocapsa rosea TaxID=69360 RepID=A0A495VDI8_9GAMM|nr:glycosyltransferase family 4 protein [Thiocapsa rosea]RKT47456.1 glycosyltransferase involved in cell wall biosynthesis [Thiocapsa rosea]
MSESNKLGIEYGDTPNPSRLSIALCAPSLGQGGAERVVCWLCDGLANRGHDVLLVTRASRSEDFYPAPERARRISLIDDFRVKSGPLQLLALYRVLKSLRPDITISFLPRTNVACALTASVLKCPVVVCERADPRSEPLHWTTSAARVLAYPLAAGIVLQADTARTWAARRVRGGVVGVIPNPVRPLLRPPHVVGGPILLGVGRLCPQKRFDRLIRAFASVAPDFPDLNLRIIGDGPLRNELRDLADASGFGARIALPGATLDIEAEYARARLFVLTSDFEGFPNVLVEAMSLGLPVIALDCPTGPAEIIRDGVDGILVPKGDEMALTRTLRMVLSDDQLAARLGRKAVEIQLRFAPEGVLDQWESFLWNLSTV